MDETEGDGARQRLLADYQTRVQHGAGDKLAAEAADNGLLAPEFAAGVSPEQFVPRPGKTALGGLSRLRNWSERSAKQALEIDFLKGACSASSNSGRCEPWKSAVYPNLARGQAEKTCVIPGHAFRGT